MFMCICCLDVYLLVFAHIFVFFDAYAKSEYALTHIFSLQIVNRRLDEWVEESRLDFSKIETKAAEVTTKQETETSTQQVKVFAVVGFSINILSQSNATRTRLKKRQYEETNNVQKVCLISLSPFSHFPIYPLFIILLDKGMNAVSTHAPNLSLRH
jgi:hypothetical protein